MTLVSSVLIVAAILGAGVLACLAIEGWHQLAERKARRRG